MRLAALLGALVIAAQPVQAQDYVKAKGTIARPAAADYSHQKVISKAGVALP